MNRIYGFCGQAWIFALVVSAGIAALAFSGGRAVAVMCGLFASLLSVFIGALTASMVERFKVKLQKSDNPQEVSMGVGECKDMALRVSRLVVDRVSDRLVAKMSQLHNDEQREAVFGDADQIVDEEMEAIEVAMDGIEKEFLPK